MARILVGYSCCPKTRDALVRQGHEVWTCDKFPRRGDDQHHHIQGDVWIALLSQKWDAAILHPMCTNLTTSAAWAFFDPDFEKYPGVGYHQKVKPGTLTGAARREAREADLNNFRALLNLNIKYIAIENPAVSFVNKAIRGPDQVVQPYEYGDDASKSTGWWLKGLPPLTPTNYVPPSPRKNGSYRWANQTDTGQNRLSPGDNRWLERSETYPGIAEAIGDQWGRFLKQEVN